MLNLEFLVELMDENLEQEPSLMISLGTWEFLLWKLFYLLSYYYYLFSYYNLLSYYYYLTFIFENPDYCILEYYEGGS